MTLRRYLAFLDHGQVGHQSIDLRLVSRLPCLYLGLTKLGNLNEQIYTFEQDVDLLGTKDHSSLLRRHEAVFHRVCHAHSGIKANDSRSASSECAARISGSIIPGVAELPSSDTSPAESVAVWLSASMRKSSIIEKPLRSPLTVPDS